MAHRLTLWGSKHCADGFLPWYAPVSSAGLGDLPAGRIYLTVNVDGKPFLALFDTGSHATTMTVQAATKIGLGDWAKSSDPFVMEIGADGHPLEAHNHHFNSVSLGPDKIADTHILVGRFFIFNGIDMMFGIDYLKSRRVWIDYSNHVLYAQPSSVPTAKSAHKSNPAE